MTVLSDPLDVVRSGLASLTGPIAVTGATGWLGLVALDMLYAALGDEAPERVVGFASRSRAVAVADGRVAPVRPLDELPETPLASGGVLHFAFLTPDRLAPLGPQEYVSRNRTITETVASAVSTQRPAWLVVASSGAAHEHRAVANAHPYGELKREAEGALAAAARKVGATCVVPRIFSMAGPRTPRSGLYAFGDLVEMAALGGPVVVRAGHGVYRTYCGSDEVVALAIWAATQGRDATFDTCGESIEMGDLALRIAAAHGLHPNDVRRGPADGAGADVYVGNGEAMRTLADEAGLRLRSLDQLIAASSAARS